MTYFIENCHTFLVNMYCLHLYSNNPTDEVTINRQTLHFLTFMSDRTYKCPMKNDILSDICPKDMKKLFSGLHCINSNHPFN